MKILITGGAGFIGSYVVRACIEAGHETHVFDSFVTGKRENVPGSAVVHEGDIRDRAALANAMSGMTHVVHLAALVSVPESIEQPEEYHDVNVTGFANVLEAARHAEVRRVAFASSAAVYGDDPSLPKREDMPIAPQSPYAFSKAVNELQAEQYLQVYGLASVGFRFFNVYGKGQAADHPYASVIPRWLRMIGQGTPLIMYGDGSQTRDFVHATDVAQAILAGLSTDASAPVYNVATGIETSLTELHGLLREHRGDIEVDQRQERPGDIRRSVADILLIRTDLGWSPQVAFKDGIIDLVS